MADTPPGLQKKNHATEELIGVKPTNLQSVSSFKYYIHDSVSECRLQLLGDLTGAQVTDLSGCWQTVRTTLGTRRLSLDVRGLKSADAAGRRWLDQMANEGAVFLPESFSRQSPIAPGKGAPKTVEAIKLSLFGRVLALFGKASRSESAEPALRAGDAG